LYAEYILGYIGAIRRAPLSPAERRECYRYLARWVAGRTLPFAGRTLSRSGLQVGGSAFSTHSKISVDGISVADFVAGRERRNS
jgi:hypothetical protein